jgi:hypothetical protein
MKDKHADGAPIGTRIYYKRWALSVETWLCHAYGCNQSITTQDQQCPKPNTLRAWPAAAALSQNHLGLNEVSMLNTPCMWVKCVPMIQS